MADILIRGMEMPKYGCDHCFLRTGNYCGRIEKNEGVVEYARKSERHPDCPLIPLPEGHGRLIDADALIKEIDDRSMSDSDWWYEDRIDEMPTIVPEEGGDEE